MPEEISVKQSSAGAPLYTRAIRNKWLWDCCFGLSLLSLMSTSSAEAPAYLAGDLRGYSHTAAAINGFSVNGYGGGPTNSFGESGAACCIALPSTWRPGLMLEVEWETDPNATEIYPQVGTDAFRAYMVEHEKKYRQLKATVELPPYDNGVCGMEVHFLPCDEVKVSTSCWRYPSPNSPIKEPRKMKEPATCPKK